MYHYGATETRELTAAGLLHQIPIIVNAAAGSVTDSEDVCKRLCRAFSAVGCQVECRTLQPENIGRYLRILIDERPVAVGVAGGDGTMSSCATALAGTDIALVPLPLGTRNHFAQDLGVPLNLEDAARALAGGRIHAIDMGQVNGQLFLNNASVGLYTRAVRWRGSLLAERPMDKRLATLYVLAVLARRLPRYRLLLEIDGSDSEALCVPFLFVGNNRYAEGPLNLVSRRRLDGGRLHLTCPARADYPASLRLLFGLLLRPLVQLPDLQTLDAGKLSLRARRRHMTVALDGELHRMAQPLQFRIRKGILRVLLPADLP